MGDPEGEISCFVMEVERRHAKGALELALPPSWSFVTHCESERDITGPFRTEVERDSLEARYRNLDLVGAQHWPRGDSRCDHTGLAIPTKPDKSPDRARLEADSEGESRPGDQGKDL